MSVEETLRAYRFYHIIEVAPGVFTPGVEDNVPIQRLVLEALRRMDLRGKRVLDVGCRDGLFCFEAERLGASEVVGIDNDLSAAATEFLIPHFRSSVRMVAMNVMDLHAETFGRFDLVIFAGVLYHLRYPVSALRRLRDVMSEAGRILIETGIFDGMETHAMLYCPVHEESPYEGTSVTFFNLKGLTDTLRTLGLTTQETRTLLPRAPLFRGPRSLLRELRLKLLHEWLGRSRDQLGIGPLPTNRALLLCERTPGTAVDYVLRYWDGIHGLHSGRPSV
jgi:SAM-dependent methyltransferase